ncbi:MAG: transglutaminase family protein [Kineosporiaceae bacterium]
MPTLIAGPVTGYLVPTSIVDADHPEVIERSRALGAPGARATEPQREAYAERAFTWVRDEIAHNVDVRDTRVTVTASQVLAEGVGVCFAKSHLLAALLRAGGVPAGLCYQRLADDVGGHLVHGLVAVHLRDGWHRLDARGNRPGLDARFDLDVERVAWTARPELGEADYRDVLVDAAPEVIEVLRGAADALALCAGGLPAQLPLRS